MSATPPPPLDIVSLAVTLLSLVFSASAAAVVGPYAVILICAIGGASWSASNVAEANNRRTLLHIVLWSGIAAVFTVPTATLGNSLMFSLFGVSTELRWMLGPVAGLIAAHPQWLVERVRAIFDRRIGHTPRGEEGEKS